MDALKKLLETAQQLQEAALQAELDKIRIQETSVTRPRPRQDWSSSETAPAAQQWSGGGQGAVHSAWVDPASLPVQRSAEAVAEEEVSLADRLRDPETLRTFFLLAEAFGPPPGLREDDDW